MAVEGRLDWREWESQDGGKRQAVEIIANSVQFLGSRGDNPGGENGGDRFKPTSDVPADTSDFEGAGVSGGSGGAASRTTTFPSRRAFGRTTP